MSISGNAPKSREGAIAPSIALADCKATEVTQNTYLEWLLPVHQVLRVWAKAIQPASEENSMG